MPTRPVAGDALSLHLLRWVRPPRPHPSDGQERFGEDAIRRPEVLVHSKRQSARVFLYVAIVTSDCPARREVKKYVPPSGAV